MIANLLEGMEHEAAARLVETANNRCCRDTGSAGASRSTRPGCDALRVAHFLRWCAVTQCHGLCIRQDRASRSSEFESLGPRVGRNALAAMTTPATSSPHRTLVRRQSLTASTRYGVGASA